MKIAFIEPGLHVCGGIRRILETSNKLVDFGHDVTIYHPKGTKPSWIPPKAKIEKLAKIGRQEFDVAIFNLAEQYKDALLVNAAKKIFWVLAPEALYKNPEIPIKALRQDFIFVANSTFSANYVKRYNPKVKDVPIVPGAINPKHFHIDASIKKQYDVAYYGSNRPWKGTSIIESAVKIMKKSSIKMEGLNLPQNKLYTLYNSAKIFVSAAQVEGFSFPDLEAMACGCAVVTTDNGGNKDFVKHMHNAYMVNRTATGVVQGIKTLLNNPDICKKLIQNGLETAAQSKFTWESSARKFEQILMG